MGYTTTYKGTFLIEPPVDDHRFLAAWRDAIGDSRGSTSDFFADLPGGLTHFDWEPVVDQQVIGEVTISCIVGVAHNGTEKSYDAEAWLTWLARTHLKPRGSSLLGTVECVGEDADTWTLLADGEEVTRVETDLDPVAPVPRGETDLAARWELFADRELREVYEALATAPTAGTHRSHGMIDEITVEANRRGRERAEAILR